MRKRTRKLIGTATILLVVIVYGPVAMALADSRIALAPQAVQVLAYMVLGLVWILPLLPLIRWMEKPDAEGRQFGPRLGSPPAARTALAWAGRLRRRRPPPRSFRCRRTFGRAAPRRVPSPCRSGRRFRPCPEFRARPDLPG